MSKYMMRRRRPPSQSWRTFLRNHAEAIAAIDLCVVPTVHFEHLLAFIIVGHGRRQLLWFAVSVPYLEKAEIDALLAAPDRSTLQGAREHALLLFLYNTGARVSEATGVRIGDVDWHSKSVRITGKGSKQRRCPLWGETIEQLRCLAGERPDDASLFVNCRGEPYTRYGVHTLVERYVAKLRAVTPAPQGKRISLLPAARFRVKLAEKTAP